MDEFHVQNAGKKSQGVQVVHAALTFPTEYIVDIFADNHGGKPYFLKHMKQPEHVATIQSDGLNHTQLFHQRLHGLIVPVVLAVGRELRHRLQQQCDILMV